MKKLAKLEGYDPKQVPGSDSKELYWVTHPEDSLVGYHCFLENPLKKNFPKNSHQHVEVFRQAASVRYLLNIL